MWLFAQKIYIATIHYKSRAAPGRVAKARPPPPPLANAGPSHPPHAGPYAINSQNAQNPQPDTVDNSRRRHAPSIACQYLAAFPVESRQRAFVRPWRFHFASFLRLSWSSGVEFFSCTRILRRFVGIDTPDFADVRAIPALLSSFSLRPRQFSGAGFGRGR